jgi:hypothetical protein
LAAGEAEATYVSFVGASTVSALAAATPTPLEPTTAARHEMTARFTIRVRISVQSFFGSVPCAS